MRRMAVGFGDNFEVIQAARREVEMAVTKSRRKGC